MKKRDTLNEATKTLTPRQMARVMYQMVCRQKKAIRFETLVMRGMQARWAYEDAKNM